MKSVSSVCWLMSGGSGDQLISANGSIVGGVLTLGKLTAVAVVGERRGEQGNAETRDVLRERQADGEQCVQRAECRAGRCRDGDAAPQRQPLVDRQPAGGTAPATMIPSIPRLSTRRARGQNAERSQKMSGVAMLAIATRKPGCRGYPVGRSFKKPHREGAKTQIVKKSQGRTVRIAPRISILSQSRPRPHRQDSRRCFS